MELLADRDSEEARKLLDPALELQADRRYEGTVNRVTSVANTTALIGGGDSPRGDFPGAVHARTLVLG